MTNARKDVTTSVDVTEVSKKPIGASFFRFFADCKIRTDSCIGKLSEPP